MIKRFVAFLMVCILLLFPSCGTIKTATKEDIEAVQEQINVLEENNATLQEENEKLNQLIKVAEEFGRLNAMFDFIDNGDGTVSISQIHTTAESIEIPKYYNGHKVTKVLSTSGTEMYRETLKTVTFPNSIKEIAGIPGADYGPFYMCSGIETVVLPDGLEVLGNSSFNECENLTSVTIPKSIRNMFGNSFYHCFNLHEITYLGTIEEWNNIPEGRPVLPNIVIHCIDGDWVDE